MTNKERKKSRGKNAKKAEVEEDPVAEAPVAEEAAEAQAAAEEEAAEAQAAADEWLEEAKNNEVELETTDAMKELLDDMIDEYLTKKTGKSREDIVD